MHIFSASCLFVLALGAEENKALKKAHSKLKAYIEQVQDPFDSGVAPLLERIVELDPEDAGARGDLALQRVHRNELPQAVELLRGIESHAKATMLMKSTAAEFANVLAAAVDKESEAIAKLRHLAADIFLLATYNEMNENPNFLYGVQGECLHLVSELDKFAGGPRPHLVSYVPGLIAQPFWEARRFELGAALEDAAVTISKEVKQLRISQKLWKPVGRHTGKIDKQIVAKGKWVDALLFRKGSFNKKVCAVMKETCALLKTYPEITTAPLGMVLVSELLPGTSVSEHVGQANSVITFHLGLQLPADTEAGIRVDGQDGGWSMHKVTAFDDAFPHSVWHNGTNSSVPRTVLLVRAWHPQLSPVERQVGLITAANANSKDTWEDEDVEAALQALQAKEAERRWEAQLQQLNLGSSAKRTASEELS